MSYHAPDPDMLNVCRSCGRECYWTPTHARHGRRCGAPMRDGERCHRRAGHKPDARGRATHRTAPAVAYQNALGAARYRRMVAA